MSQPFFICFSVCGQHFMKLKTFFNEEMKKIYVLVKIYCL